LVVTVSTPLTCGARRLEFLHKARNSVMPTTTSLPAPQPSPPSIEVLRAVDLGDGRSVATIRVGSIRLGSVFVVDGSVSWPRTARGFEIISIDDDALRQRVEAAILARVAGGAA
jgi:hypothetical protein